MDHRPPRPDQPYAWDDERLSAYLDGELSAPEQAQLEARLVVDPELRQLVDELRAVRQQLEILPEYRLQTTFADQVLRRAEQEMLLSPVVRETTSVSSAAATTALPTVSYAANEPAVERLPHRPAVHHSMVRRWRRGAIWTAIAAAAVLLLIVTNRPLDPEQDHIARNDPNTKVTVQHGAAKLPNTQLGSAQHGSDSATFPTTQDGAAERLVLDKLRRDAKGTETDPTADAPLATQMQQSDAQKSLEKQAAAFPDPSNVGPEYSSIPNNGPAAAAAMPAKPTAPQLARTAGAKSQGSAASLADDGKAKSNEVGSNDVGDKRKLDAASDKLFFKNQAFGTVPENQTTPRRKELSADLTAFFDSDSFKQLLTRPLDAKKRDEATLPADEQILVVYVTPRSESATGRTFESLLTSNSIELAEKSLNQPMLEGRPLPHSKLEKSATPAAEAMAKGKSEPDGTQDRKATEARGASKPEEARAASQQLQDKSVIPESQPSAEQDFGVANELYYLEADEGQVQELLRQLRIAPDRFTRLSIASRELPQAGARTELREEQSLAMKSSPTLTGRKPAEGLAAAEPSRENENGKQMQLAQASPGAPPNAPPAPVVPTPAAEPSIAPTPAPPTASEAAPKPAAPAMAMLPKLSAPAANSAPAGGDIVPSAIPASENPTPKADSFIANSAKTEARHANETLQDADARSNRRALAMDTQLQSKGERVIAYRLRGLEALSDEGRKPANSRGQESTAGGGGAAGGFANTEIGNAPTGAAIQPGQSDKKNDKLETGNTASQNSNGEMPGQSAQSGLAAPFSAAASSEANASPETKAKDQSEVLRLMPGNKETELAQKNPPTESAKKSTAPATKRVRVLFVIEHESGK